MSTIKKNNQNNTSQNEKKKNKRDKLVFFAPIPIADELSFWASQGKFNDKRLLVLYDLIPTEDIHTISMFKGEEGLAQFEINSSLLSNIDYVSKKCSLFFDCDSINQPRSCTREEIESILDKQHKKVGEKTIFSYLMENFFSFGIKSLTSCSLNDLEHNGNKLLVNNIDLEKVDVIIAVVHREFVTETLLNVVSSNGNLDAILFVPEITLNTKFSDAFCKHEMYYGKNRHVDVVVTYENGKKQHWRHHVYTTYDDYQKKVIDANGPLKTGVSFTLREGQFGKAKCLVENCLGELCTPFVVDYACYIPDDTINPFFFPKTGAYLCSSEFYDIYAANTSMAYNRSTESPYYIEGKDKAYMKCDDLVMCSPNTDEYARSQKFLAVPTKKCKSHCDENAKRYLKNKSDDFAMDIEKLCEDLDGNMSIFRKKLVAAQESPVVKERILDDFAIALWKAEQKDNEPTKERKRRNALKAYHMIKDDCTPQYCITKISKKKSYLQECLNGEFVPLELCHLNPKGYGVNGADTIANTFIADRNSHSYSEQNGFDTAILHKICRKNAIEFNERLVRLGLATLNN